MLSSSKQEEKVKRRRNRPPRRVIDLRITARVLGSLVRYVGLTLIVKGPLAAKRNLTFGRQKLLQNNVERIDRSREDKEKGEYQTNPKAGGDAFVNGDTQGRQKNSSDYRD
ncbi:MAG: hypothetical protein ACJAZ9_000427 [Neolewinella sp.]|jgi:hypothetical protein